MVWLKRHFWVVNVATIAVVAMLLAGATSHLLEAKFLLGSTSARPARAPALAEAPRAKDTMNILRRNIFCADCPPFAEFAPPVDAGPTSDDPVKSSLPLALVTTLVSDDPSWSIAILRDTQSKNTGAFKVESPIPPDVHIDAIDETRVYLRRADGRLEYLDLLDGSKVSGEAGAVATTEPASTSGGDLDKDIEAGIKKISDTRYTIQRALLDKLLADTTALARCARIVPAVVDGKPSGFKLYAIRPTCVYAKIGLQNGDTVRAINGNEMTSPDKALEVYTKLRSASHLNLAIQRRGKDLALDYTIGG